MGVRPNSLLGRGDLGPQMTALLILERPEHNFNSRVNALWELIE